MGSTLRSRRWTRIVALALAGPGCVLTVDLRDPDLLGDRDAPGGDTDCGPAERFDSEQGACVPCTYDDPRAVCPCGYTVSPEPSVPCDPSAPPFTCNPACVGDIEVCTGYADNGGAPGARDCALLLACCTSLAQDLASEPCCPDGRSLLCTVGGIDGYPYDVGCVDNGPCAAQCDDDGDCAPFQSCGGGLCTPGCDPRQAYCAFEAGGFACRPYVP